MWRGELRAVATARRAPSGCAQPCAVGEEVWLEGEPASKPGVGGHRIRSQRVLIQVSRQIEFADLDRGTTREVASSRIRREGLEGFLVVFKRALRVTLLELDPRAKQQRHARFVLVEGRDNALCTIDLAGADVHVVCVAYLPLVHSLQAVVTDAPVTSWYINKEY